MGEALETIESVWNIIMVILLLGTGILLTIVTRFFQVRKFPYIIKSTIGSTIKKRGDKSASASAIPQFEAFATAIAGTIGTGNIVGVATALVAGGPGAIFWMWVSAFFGMMTKFSENVLGIYYRKRNHAGEFVGGPMYYIENGLGSKWKWMAIAFAVLTMIASFGFNITQMESISTAFEVTFHIPRWVSGVLVAILIAIITIGGIKRIGKVASIIVPFMALIFMVMGIIVIGINYENIGRSLSLICTEAFSFKSLGSGIGGYIIMRAMNAGLSRGVFSNEAGLGSSVMAHSSSDVKEPVQQGMWGVFEVFLDTIVICTIMALVYLTTNSLGMTDASGQVLDGAALALAAFGKDLGKVGQVVFTIILPLFAFTTILTWSYYGEKATEYFAGKKGTMIFKPLYVGVVVLGSLVHVGLAWDISTALNALMTIPNLLALIMLSPKVREILVNYLKRHNKKHPEALVPMVSCDPVENDRIAREIALEEDAKHISLLNEMIIEDEIKEEKLDSIHRNNDAIMRIRVARNAHNPRIKKRMQDSNFRHRINRK